MTTTSLTKTFDGLNVRIFLDDAGEPWFVAADVAHALGFDHAPHATRILEDDEKGVRIVDTPGGPQSLTVCNEAGVYSLVLQSRQERARDFRRWLKHDVLPSIRKTGSYGEPQKLDLSDPHVLTLYARDLTLKVLEQQKQLAEAKPKVEAFDGFLTADGSYCLRDAGKMLGMGGNKFAWSLEERGYLYRNGNHTLVPYQEHVERGLFVLRAGHHTAGDERHVHEQARVTPKGLDHFRRLYAEQGAIA